MTQKDAHNRDIDNSVRYAKRSSSKDNEFRRGISLCLASPITAPYRDNHSAQVTIALITEKQKNVQHLKFPELLNSGWRLLSSWGAASVASGNREERRVGQTRMGGHVQKCVYGAGVWGRRMRVRLSFCCCLTE